ncbi:hypothetical protein ACWCXB_01490 [Streptomyces sp. NPDC001514]
MSADSESREETTSAFVPPAADGLQRRLVAALTCAAVEPALSGVLLFDLPAELVAPVSEAFAALLVRAAGLPDGTPVRRTALGAATRDEDLWARPQLRRGPGGIGFTLVPGPLTETGEEPSLVVVPDLARLSLAGMRAAVQVLGADAAPAELAGPPRQWRPRARWLAVCQADDTVRISPHLLDRFPIRLSVAGLRTLPGTGPLGALPDSWHSALVRAEEVPPPPFAEAAATRVLELLEHRAGHRRPLALARIARALARLGGAGEVTADRVDEAARLIGLPQAPPGQPGPEPVPRPDVTPAAGPDRARGRGPGSADRAPDGQSRVPAGTPVLEPGPPEHMGGGPAPGSPPSVTPYPEDATERPPDSAFLRIPARRFTGPLAARGAVIGVRRAHDLWDLALVRTAMEAAKYQVMRGSPERLAIAPADLRVYVRAPEPERLLALVLDHTCRDDWDWHEALEPFLQWAYISRAAAHVVEIGGRGAVNELRAEAFAARSVLDPRIAAALARAPGRSTPLAHGLEQAGHALRRAFQHHSSGQSEALLVVVTDGRGNVPLHVSHEGRPRRSAVGRAGVDDALAAAARISGMDRTRLHCVVVDPARQPYAELPYDLADALGGSVVEGRPAEGAARHVG